MSDLAIFEKFKAAFAAEFGRPCEVWLLGRKTRLEVMVQDGEGYHVVAIICPAGKFQSEDDIASAVPAAVAAMSRKLDAAKG